MRLEWIEELRRFDEVAGPWERLAEDTGLPFVRHSWFRAWWEAFGNGGRELRVLTLWDGDDLAAGIALSARGERLEALANEHTPVFAPVARDDDALAVASDALAEVRARAIVLPALRSPDALARAARRRRYLASVQVQQISPCVETATDYEEYLRGLDRKSRKEWARLRRRLEEEHGAAFVPLAAPAELRRELEDGFALEASGWKGGTSIKADQSTAAFYTRLAEAFAEAGRLRLSTIRVEGRPVAFDYCLVDGGRLWILKGGYDRGFARFGPGILLTLAEIERAHELGLASVELLGDIAPWKLRFATGSRPHYSLHAYSRRPAPIAGYAYRSFLRPRLRRAYRRVHPSRG